MTFLYLVLALHHLQFFFVYVKLLSSPNVLSFGVLRSYCTDWQVDTIIPERSSSVILKGWIFSEPRNYSGVFCIQWGSTRLAGGFSFSGIALPSLAADKSAFHLACQPCVLLLATRKRVPCFKYIWLFSLSCFNLFVVYGFISFVFFTAVSKCNKQKAS